MFKTFWHYSGKKRWLLFVAPLAVLGEVIAELQQPNLLAEIVNTYQTGGSAAIVWQVGLKMVAYLILSVACSLVSIYTANLVAAFFGRNLRQDLFTKIQNLSLAQVESLTPGSLLTRLTNDVNQAQNLLIQILRLAARAPLMLLGSLFFLAKINFSLLRIVLILSPFILLTVFVVAKLALPLFRKLQAALDRLNNQMSESLSNIRTIKSFNREKLEIDKFSEDNQALARFEKQGGQIMAAAMPIMMFIFNLAIAFVLYQGATLFGHGSLEIGSLIAAIGYLSQLLFSFMMVSFVFLSIMRTKVSVERINKVMHLQPSLTEKAHPTAQKIEQGAIKFDNVSFAYKKAAGPVLCDLSLSIPAGETVGFIGITGSGKTTLALLLNRLYDPTTGAIFIDGQDLRDYPLSEVKNKIVLVLQEAILLSGTIEENLTWGDRVTEDKIEQALDISQAETFVSQKPEKIRSDVARRGNNFSGGQKQRLSLARALTRDFKILVLDDTTSALDLKTAAAVQKALKEKVDQATKIMISQRIATVRECDRIVVMNEGKIHGVGTHEQLLKTDEIYQEINKIQEEEQ
ncbi:MAG: ABC transporter ATP-binding protein [bacterium]|nr:ABC transporter ATP-binding protein [bacterium]